MEQSRVAGKDPDWRGVHRQQQRVLIGRNERVMLGVLGHPVINYDEIEKRQDRQVSSEHGHEPEIMRNSSTYGNGSKGEGSHD